MNQEEVDKSSTSDIDAGIEDLLALPGWREVKTGKKISAIADRKFGDRTIEDIRLTFGDEVANSYEQDLEV